MEEKEIKEVENPEVHEEPKSDSLTEVIKKQQEKLANSVPKDDYDKVLQDNKQLKDIIVNGGPYPGEDEEKETIDVNELSKHIFNPDNQDNNLEYVKNALKYRKAKLESDGIDVFAPQIGINNSSEISDDDFAAAEKVADVLQECVDECDNDPQVFTAKLMSRIMDDSPVKNAFRAKRR